MGFGAVLFAAMEALSDADKKDREAAIVKLGDTIELQISPAGEIIEFGGSSAPTGHLECDGAAISRSTYSVLFAAIGTTWGVGNGSTTFNVPDLRGGFVRGAGSHGSATMADGNPFAGPAVGSFGDDRLQGHYHEVSSGAVGFDRAVTIRTGGNAFIDSGVNNAVFDPKTNGSDGTPRTGDETRPFAAGVLYCIKT